MPVLWTNTVQKFVWLSKRLAQKAYSAQILDLRHTEKFRSAQKAITALMISADSLMTIYLRMITCKPVPMATFALRELCKLNTSTGTSRHHSNVEMEPFAHRIVSRGNEKICRVPLRNTVTMNANLGLFVNKVRVLSVQRARIAPE